MTSQRTTVPPAPGEGDQRGVTIGAGPEGETGPYTIRPFREDDEEEVLALGGGELAPMERREWFEWAAHENPYVDHVPVSIVEQAGQIVAALPFLAFRIRDATAEGVAFGCGEPIVAVGRDRKELAARAATGAVDYYVAAALDERPPAEVDVVTSAAVDEHAAAADIDEFPAMFFAVGPPAAEGFAKAVPWSRHDERAAAYRIQRHGAFVANRIPGPPGRWLGAGISAVTSGVRRARDRRASFDTEPYTVMRHRGAPDATLAACFERSLPPDAHVVYDQAFYDWWYSRPSIEDVTSYVVYRGSEVVAGLVTHRDKDEDDRIEALHVDNVVPVTGDPKRPRAIAAGMERLLAEHTDVDVIRTANPLFPNSVLSAYGFRNGAKFPTSLVAGETEVLGLRPLIEGQRVLGNRPIGETGPFLWPLA